MRHLRRLLVALLLLAVAAGVGWWLLRGRTFTVKLERAQLQAAVDARLPLEKDALLVLRLRIPRATVLLAEGADRIGMRCAVELDLRVGAGRELLAGELEADTRLRYDPARHAFFLTDPVVRDASVKGLPAQHTALAAKYAGLALARFAADHPVHVIQDDSLKLRLARAVLREVRVEDGKLVAVLGY